MPSIPFTLRQLEYFNAIASEGSLAAAATRCNVSASALALALDELEYQLSLQLFIRRKAKGVTLTPAGSRLLSHARRILAGAETLAADASQASSSLTGRFAIGCFPTLAPFYLPGIMQDFARRHPGLTLEITEAAAPELDELLLQGRIDVALMYSVDVSPQFAFDPVREYRPYAMVAKGHRLASRKSIHLGELVSEPLILIDVHPSRLNIDHTFGSLNLRPRIGHTTTSFELVRCLVARGLGYGVLFQRPATTTTYDGNELVTLELDGRFEGTVVGLARPAGAPRTARHDALLDYFATLTPQK
ncbi:MAG: LysR family transcriptional regulator [Gammaproteobacteria bacterium]|nr:LysR family transcriptional regulator [Gammaproteobacteria bacterium]